MNRASIVTGLGLGERMQLVEDKPGRYVVATLRNVILFYWVADATVEDVAMLDALCAKLLKSHERLSAIHLIKEGVGLPTAPVRKALAASMERFSDVTACLGVVMLGAGFWASALQSAITGIRMMASTRESLLRFSRDLQSLQGWFSQDHERMSGVRLDETLLIISLEQLRSMGDRGVTATAP